MKESKTKIKRILISQPQPAEAKSPYYDLAESNNIELVFRPFIHVEGLEAKEFRKQKVDILAHTAVIFTSRLAIDHFFKLCEVLRVSIPDTMKYFCVSEAIAVYLQKYIIYRKRKIFHSTGKFIDLLEILKKHKDEKYLLTLADIHKQDVPDLLDKYKFTYSKAIIYKTVSSDMSDIKPEEFDAFVFFSPQGITSLFSNFPEFKQGDLKIGTFGPTTAQAAKEAGLRVDIQAPVPEFPSMTSALDNYIKKHNKGIK
jgi:uroporphyrinogen-III synthase